MPDVNGPVPLPNGYHEVLHWRVTEKPTRVIASQILSALCFVIFGFVFVGLAVGFGKLPSNREFGLGEVGLVVAGILLTLILHELIHGLVMQISGAKPRFGILWKGMMLYTTSPEHAYRRNNYVVILLTPLVLISVLVVLGIWLLQGTLWVVLLGICGAVNASGAVGDIWITAIVLRYAATARIIDERDGIRVLVPKP